MNRQVIGVSSYSGDGKTTLIKHLIKSVEDSVGIFFDDYGDSIESPPMDTWATIENYDGWKCPLLAEHLEKLKSGQSIVHPETGKEVHSAKHIFFDAALGKGHRETGQFIDLMVFIDTPLDVAMARRLLRDYTEEKGAEKMLSDLRQELELYLDGRRQSY